MTEAAASDERILVVRLSAFGDVILTLPALASLRAARPAARLAWVVEDRAAGILRDHPDLDEVIVLPRRAWKERRREHGRAAVLREMRAFGRELARREFDASLDFQGNLKSGLVTRAAGARRRLGFARGSTREPNWLFTNDRVRPTSPDLHRSDRDLELVRALAAEARPAAARLGIGEADRTAIAHLVAGDPAAPLVVIHPGTSDFFAQKRWPLERWAVVAARLAAERGARVVLSWGPGEREQVDEVRRGAPAATIADRVLEPLELAALLSEADLVLGSDTGPTHLGSVLGRPTVALFGPYDPRPLHPHGHPDRARYAALPCSPCRYRDCPRALCMEELGVDEILASAEAALDGREAPPGPRAPRKTVAI
ncbi:MAG: glycosyltransferase family 9 protein [Planctomycetota bacterium]